MGSLPPLLWEKGAVLRTLLRQRTFGPIAPWAFGAPPDRVQPDLRPEGRCWEPGYAKADAAMRS